MSADRAPACHGRAQNGSVNSNRIHRDRVRFHRENVWDLTCANTHALRWIRVLTLLTRVTPHAREEPLEIQQYVSTCGVGRECRGRARSRPRLNKHFLWTRVSRLPEDPPGMKCELVSIGLAGDFSPSENVWDLTGAPTPALAYTWVLAPVRSHTSCYGLKSLGAGAGITIATECLASPERGHGVSQQMDGASRQAERQCERLRARGRLRPSRCSVRYEVLSRIHPPEPRRVLGSMQETV